MQKQPKLKIFRWIECQKSNFQVIYTDDFILLTERNSFDPLPINEWSWQAENRTRKRHVIELFIPFVNDNPYPGTKRTLMIFNIKKRSQLVKTISLRNPIESHFLFNDVRSSGKFIFDIHFNEKCLIWIVLANFIDKDPF